MPPCRSERTLVPMKTLLLATLAGLVLMGCGPAAQTASHPSPTPNVAAIVRQLMDCIHTHGAPDFPDPTLDNKGMPTWPDGTAPPPQSVIDACQSIYNQLPQPDRGHILTPAELHLAQQFAQCMREQGYPDWPDPNKDGSYPLPADITAEGKSPHLLAAWQACARYNPSGHITSSH
jgi:hypothetical protein